MTAKIYFLDNFDSFTYNLVDEFSQLGFELVVYRNNVSAEHIFAQIQAESQPVLLVLSPGPGAPSEAGCMPELIRLCADKVAMLGICLGHQALVEHFGGVVGRAGETIHGKMSYMHTTPHPVFHNLSQPMPIARYHSLTAQQVPSCLTVIGRTDFAEQPLVMAISHQQLPIIGYQFHPESILTPDGSQLLAQTIHYLLDHQGAA